MNDKLKLTWRIDPELESYRTIFGHEWARNISEIVEGTQLELPLFKLCANWRAAANAHAWPWLMMHSLAGLWNGAVKHEGPTQQFIAAMPNAISERMTGKITRMKQRELAKVAQGLADEINQRVTNHPDLEMRPEDMWQRFLTPECWELAPAIWGAQQSVFGALFYAFEHYVTSLVGIWRNKPDYRPHWNDLVKDAKKLLDPIDSSVVSQCLAANFVEVAREIRNCLAHRGGNESEALRELGHDLPVEDGIIQVMAPHNERCIRGLEGRVRLLTETAVKLPQFQVEAIGEPKGNTGV